jgi:hypothetical protein
MNIIKVIDPRLNFQSNHDVFGLSGASYINSIQYPTASLSNSSIVIQANPSSPRVAVDSVIFLHMAFSITVNGTNTSSGPTASPLLVSSLYAPSVFPLRQIITSESLSINGTTAQIQNPNLFMPAIMSTYASGERYVAREFSMTPSMPDTSLNFLQLPASMTSIKNPLSSVYDACIDVPRGAFPGFIVTSNPLSGTQATLTLDCCEPLITSPLKFGEDSFNSPGMIGINNLLYVANIANLNRILSIAYPLVGTNPPVPTLTLPNGAGTLAITSIVVNVTKAELIIMNSSLYSNVPVPPILFHEYNEVIDYNTSNNTPCPPGAGQIINLNNNVIGSIPRSMYIFVSANDVGSQTTNAYSCTYPTAFLQLGPTTGGYLTNTDFHPISINFDNITQGQNLTLFDLYKISKKNGILLSFSEFAGMPAQAQAGYSSGIGTILKLDFGSDVVLNEGYTCGVSGKFQLSVSVTCWNQGLTTCMPTLHVLCIYDGLQTVSYDTTQTINHQASFVPAQILDLPINSLTFEPKSKIFGGGDLFSSIKSGIQNLVGSLLGEKPISSFAPLIGNTLGVPEIGQTIGSVASSLGLGAGAGEYRRKPSRRRIRGGTQY